MSGVYIHGMDMPKNCDECWTKFHGFGWVEHDEEWGTFYCKAGKGFCSDPRTKCPLIPVPDHGRLIDGDKMAQKDISDYESAMDKDLTISAKTAMSKAHKAIQATIMQQPTIIPADHIANVGNMAEGRDGQ